MNLSEEQILSMAPDASSQKSGRELAASSKWVSKGANEKAIWGECQGSGKNPYRTQVDRINTAFKCSCPSRKFPCKHGIGLLLNFARNAGEFTVSAMPDWVSDWIEKRADRAEKKAEKKDKPPDVAAQAKRLRQRTDKVNDGIAELQLFIKDLVRSGIMGIPEKGPQMFGHLAKRMIDAQAPGLASMIRQLASIQYYKEGWQLQCLDKLLRIYLVAEGFKRADTLDTTLQADIRSLVGFSQNTDELRQEEGIQDHWLVMGKEQEEEDQLIVQRNWLKGVHTGRYALVLNFYVRTQAPEFNLTPGTCVESELVFYKSRSPLRAIIRKLHQPQPVTMTGALDSWTAVAAAEQQRYSELPFHEELPFLVSGVQISAAGNTWLLTDGAGLHAKLRCTEDQLYKMLAMSGGQAFTLALLEKEMSCRPLGMWIQNQYFLL